MRILITGATGYIGSAVARALLARDHEVLGLARSTRSAAALQQAGIAPVSGDFGDPASVARAVTSSGPDAVVSTASVGSLGGDPQTFAQDRDAVDAITHALGDDGRTLIFTSGSAVFGVFAGGAATDTIYDEDAAVPLSREAFAAAAAGLHPMLAAGLGAAMSARVQTEQAVTAARGVRGIIVRPGLVYGRGGSFDLPAIIALARRHGHGVHLGSGATRQSYVHIDDLAELYCLAVERGQAGAILHGVTSEVSQRDLAAAAGRMIGVVDHTENLTVPQMLGLGAGARAGLLLTRRLPEKVLQRLQGRYAPPASVSTGISLCLNKRLSSSKTQHLLGWSPRRTDILTDVESGSYRGPSSPSSGPQRPPG
jgi:nucleoside-diphosphate-sugar epimerase